MIKSCYRFLNPRADERFQKPPREKRKMRALEKGVGRTIWGSRNYPMRFSRY